MERKPFVVTDLAGKQISGVRSPGSGATVFLTEAQAEHPLRSGQVTRGEKVAPKPKGK